MKVFIVVTVLPQEEGEMRENGWGGSWCGMEALLTKEGTVLLWGELCRCIARYMAIFSDKLCCFRDMRPYLSLFAVGKPQADVCAEC